MPVPPLSPLRWFIGIVGGVLAGLWIGLSVVSRAPLLQQRLVAALNDNMDADVQIDGFSVESFPMLRIRGDNLRLRLKGQKQPAPFVEVRHFDVTGSVFGLLRKQRRFKAVELDGLRITIPPRTSNDKEAGARAAGTVEGPVLIDHVVSRDAQLVIVPKDPRKEPRVFVIHTLDLQSVGFNRAMPFEATLTNPLPTGEIATSGTFGPWIKHDPGGAPLEGKYTFEHADLNTIKGIGGILSSKGTFSGRLEEIDVKGSTSTPDFSIDLGGAPVPLLTDFHAVVDGTNGNTYLKRVTAKLQETDIEAAGAVESRPDVKGRTVNLDMTIRNGRIEDVLRLAVKAQKPVMLGRIAMQAKMLLPPGKSRIVDRLELVGRFALEDAYFTDPAVQEQIAMLSRRARGKSPTDPVGRIQSDMRGRFNLQRSAIRFDPFGFDVPGAYVEIRGTYGLHSEQLSFAGTLAMDASVSKAAGGGIKEFLLKPFDPLFRKKGRGAVLPITIKGPREQPKFGLNWGKVFK